MHMHIPAIHSLHGLEFPLVGVDEHSTRRAEVLARVVRAHLPAWLRAGRGRQTRVRYRYAAVVRSIVGFYLEKYFSAPLLNTKLIKLVILAACLLP